MRKTGVGLKMFFSMLIATAMLSVSALAAEVPSFQVRGTYVQEANTLKVEVFVSGINFAAGRLALDYDQSKLSLVNANDFFEAIQTPPSVAITTETLPYGDLISEKEGYAMFAFYPRGSTIDTTKTEQLIAWMEFKLAPGVTTADFDAGTLQMRHITGDLSNWDSGLALCDNTVTWYKNCLAYTKSCHASFTYPGSDKTAKDAHAIEIKVTDSAKAPVKAEVTLQSETLWTNENGIARFLRAKGNYSYKVEASGYGEQIGVIAADGADFSKKIELIGSSELVLAARDNLKIIYQNSDSASGIFRPIGLVTTTDDNCAVAWTSSVPTVLTTDGGVFPKAGNATNVTLIAVVSKDGHSATKTFDVTVAAKSTIPPPFVPTDPDKPIDPTAPQGKKFADLAGFAWAEQAITALNEAGIINGTGETTFSPRESISRGDFLTLLMRMLKPEGTAGVGFSDVPKDSYYYNEITLAKSLGIATGETATLFRPLAGIKREDMTALTYRALRQLDYIDEAVADASVLNGFVDGNKVSEYAIAPMVSMVKNGFISGNDDKTIKPIALTNRAEAAVFLYRIYLTIM